MIDIRAGGPAVEYWAFGYIKKVNGPRKRSRKDRLDAQMNHDDDDQVNSKSSVSHQ